ncbi:MAG: hypothetical protein CBD16_01470 [Betaproteobacteria bacterium TMED156]|nr:MAG: hypothetical protein CBD16_01470 [Betaproteobacteria bacterium TMED156]
MSKSIIDPFPPLPLKHYFSIGEVSELCMVKPHVLRYWENEFVQLNPLKRKGNRRYYKTEEVLLIRKIRSLLYVEGYTINGAKIRLSNDFDSFGTKTKSSNNSDTESVTGKAYLEPGIKNKLLEILSILEGKSSCD